MSKWVPRNSSDAAIPSDPEGKGGKNRTNIRKNASVARENGSYDDPSSPASRPRGYHKSYANHNERYHEWEEDEAEYSEWADYVNVKDKVVRVELSTAELGDQDLKALTKYLDHVLNRMIDWDRFVHDQYVLNIDLSMNSYITDKGISAHLAPFLSRWPNVHRLKLYNNSLGSESVRALAPWLSLGYCRELHMSNLVGPKVSADSVIFLLMQILEKQNYPTGKQNTVPLWLRLEHNAIRGLDEILNKVIKAGLKICLKGENCKPSKCEKLARQPHVHLVQFRQQSNEERGIPDPNPPRRRDDEWYEDGWAPDNGWWEEEEWTEDWYSNSWASPKRKPQPIKELYDPYKDEKKSSNIRNHVQEKVTSPKKSSAKPTTTTLTAQDLLMGCASYGKTGPSSGKNKNEPTARDALMGKKSDENVFEVGNFPTLGSNAPVFHVSDKSKPSILKAQAAWGAAPSAVFEDKPIQPFRKERPISPPTVSSDPISQASPEWQETTAVSAETAPVESPTEEGAWRPLSHAEKEILKTHRKLRDIEKIEESIERDEKVEKNQLLKIQKKDEIASKLRELESRSQAQGGRNHRELEESEKLRKIQEEVNRETDEKNAAATLMQTKVRSWLAVKESERLAEENRIRIESEEERIRKLKILGEQRRKEEELLFREERQEQETRRHHITAQLPVDQWFYITPQGIVEGPFDILRMQQWHAHGYFQRNLMVSLNWYHEFYPLHVIFVDWTRCFLMHPAHPESELAHVLANGGVPAVFARTKEEKESLQPSYQQYSDAPAPMDPVHVPHEEKTKRKQESAIVGSIGKAIEKWTVPDIIGKAIAPKEDKSFDRVDVKPLPPKAPPVPDFPPPKPAAEVFTPVLPPPKSSPKKAPSVMPPMPAHPATLAPKPPIGAPPVPKPVLPPPKQAPDIYRTGPTPPQSPCPPMPRETATVSSHISEEFIPLDSDAKSESAAATFLKRAGLSASLESTSEPLQHIPAVSPPIEAVPEAAAPPIPEIESQINLEVGLPTPKDKKEKKKKKHGSDEEDEAEKERKALKKEKKKEKKEKEKIDNVEKERHHGSVSVDVINKQRSESTLSGERDTRLHRNSDLDDMNVMQEVQQLEQRYVGLVIGKSGDTIKTFKKITGCNMEIDQTLPEGMPRVIIYRGTQRQIAAAKKAVANLLDKTREDEERKDDRKESDRKRDSKGNLDEEPWRRDKPLRATKKTGAAKEDAPPTFGSLTGATEMMMGRPAWLQGSPTGSRTFGSEADLELRMSEPAKKSPTRSAVLSDPTFQAYGREVMMQVRSRLMKGKAYEIPEAVATIGTGERPVVEEEEPKPREKKSEKRRTENGEKRRGGDSVIIEKAQSGDLSLCSSDKHESEKPEDLGSQHETSSKAS